MLKGFKSETQIAKQIYLPFIFVFVSPKKWSMFFLTFVFKLANTTADVSFDEIRMLILIQIGDFGSIKHGSLRYHIFSSL